MPSFDPVSQGYERGLVYPGPTGFAKGLAVEPVDVAPIYVRNKVALKESER